MTALLELAKALGIDPGPLNQADLQEQTCSAALKEINKQARLLMMTRRLWLAGMESRNYFVRLADKVMAEKEVLEQERNELAAKVEPWSFGCGMAPDGGYECNCGQCE